MKKWITAFAVVIFTMIMMPTIAQADYYSQHQTLYYGMRSTQVQNLQKDLQFLGYFNHYQTTTYYGSITREAVKLYQRHNGLVADGIAGPQTARSIKTARISQTAKRFVGVPYVWGGSSTKGFDCSGFTNYVYRYNGFTIPRVSADQYTSGKWVNKSHLIPGDMVFFTTYKPGPSHVGIYIGNNKFVHASSGAGKTTISDLNNPYYKQHYIGAKRIIN